MAPGKILETIASIALQVQQSRKLEDILQWAIEEVRALLTSDRVLIYRFLSDQDAVVALESVNSEWPSVLGQLVYDPCMDAIWMERYQQGLVSTISDVHGGTIQPCYVQLLERFQVKANLVVPLRSQNTLWGLIIVHQCRNPREWHPEEIQFLQHIALHLGIAIQQATLLDRQLVIEGQPAQLPLEAKLRHYERILSATPDCVSLIDRNYIYQVVNGTYLIWNQKTYFEIVGHSVSDLLGPEFFEVHAKPLLDRCLMGESQHIVESWITYPDGKRRFTRATYSPYVETDGTISGVVINVHDLTDLKLAEAALRRQQQFTEQIAESTVAILYVYDLIEHRNIYCNQQIEAVLGYSPEEIQAIGSGCFSLLMHPEDLPLVIKSHQRFREVQGDDFLELEYRMRHKNGEYRWLLSRDRVFNRTTDGQPKQLLGVATDITALKEIQATLCQQAQRQRLLSEVAQHIRQTLDLDHILQTTVIEVRRFLQTDRVVICQFKSAGSGLIVAESVAEEYISILGKVIPDTYFIASPIDGYEQGQIKAMSDIYTANLAPYNMAFLEQMQVRAKLVVPILQDKHLWGLLVAQQCRSPRLWEAVEIEFQQQLATQLAIAIQQSELYQQVQSLNTCLELQVQERTAQLQQALQFEALLKRITDRVRDNLNETHILQTAVDELARGLSVAACDTGIYNSEQTHSTIAYESATSLISAQGHTFEIATAPHREVYPILLGGEFCQFCNIYPHPWRSDTQFLCILAIPIVDDQGVLGDLWLFRPHQHEFSDSEIRLVQQVATQCAIALRQSRLYQTAQMQVKELERLNQLKDDFLSTVSHELRSPMSSIKMATQMLEISLQPLGILEDENNPIKRYVKILQEEGRREVNLINDLLDLARLDAGSELLNPFPLNLQYYIPHLAESFQERTRQQQQHLVIDVPTNLPPFNTDLQFLERILTELLHNACKYTPAKETITVVVQATSTTLEIRVSNSGVEIEPAELERIFEKFYRIPKNDPWKHGGTGLGLALVKKLTERLGGTIRAESHHCLTTFILAFRLPL